MARIIEFTSAQSEVISGTSKTGNPYSFEKQKCYLHVEGEPYPQPTEVMVPKGAQSYQPGHYELHDNSIIIDRNGRLAIEPVLVRVAETSKPAKIAGAK